MDIGVENLFQWAAEVARPGTQTTVLLAGLVALMIALLVLMRTRWGQAKPLSKCMVLSIFVHLLLIVYAYYLQTFVAVPVPGREQVVRVNLIADIEDQPLLDPPTEEPVPREQEPWNDFVATQPLDVPPEPNALEPTPLDTPQEPPRERSPASPPMDAPELPDLPDELPDPTLPLPFPLDHAAVRPLPPASEAMPELDEPPETVPSVPRQPELPEADGPSRLVRVDDALVPNQEMPAELPLDLLAGTSAIQQIGSPAMSPVWQPPGPEAIAPRTADSPPLPAMYRNRTAGNRNELVARGGGNADTEAAVQAALAWLAAHQDPDGRWNARRHGAGQETQVLGHDRGGAGSDADTGITGLALLAFLGNGQTHRDGQHAETVRRGLEFLMRSQATDGSLAGDSRFFARMYCHGMAALAISEAYAMTGDNRLRPYVERAMRYTIQAQNPKDGGWRYLPGDSGDMSQFGWQVMAIKSAELAGIPIPETSHRGMRRFLESCSAGRHGGLAAYRPHGPPTVTMTAEALFCRLFLDARRSKATIREGVELLMRETPQSGEFNLYYWYYATIALFQLQGPEWEIWNQHLQERLLAAQVVTGPHAGSWPTQTVWGAYGGRVYTTAMAALCLEVYYRYLPLFDLPQP